jgi:hypothetical protein
VLGKPTGYIRGGRGDLGDTANYSWGSMIYNHGRAVAIFYRFHQRPSDYQQAFAILGLPPANPPYIRNVDQTMIWRAPIPAAYPNSFKGAYYCCGGLTFEDIFITGDFSEIHVYLLDLDNKSRWGASEWTTWNRLTKPETKSK